MHFAVFLGVLAFSLRLESAAFLVSLIHGKKTDRRLRPLRKENLRTYFTRFCVHSKSLFTSFAAFAPSAKFARAPFRRRCASACNSASSRCLALSSPDLRNLSTTNRFTDSRKTYAWACLTTPRSSGSGLTLWLNFKSNMSSRSTSDIPPSLLRPLALLPESEISDGTADVWALDPPVLEKEGVGA